jgi:hypothetical protein
MRTQRLTAERFETRHSAFALTLTLILATATAAGARAHEGDLKHLLILQVEPDEALALVIYEVPAGHPAALLRAMFDQDRSGHIDTTERAALAQKLSRDALRGLNLSRDDTPLPAKTLDWRLDLDPTRPDGGLLLALKIDFASGGPGRYTIAQTQDAASTLTVEADTAPPLSFSAALGVPAPDPQALGPWTLRPGDALSFIVTTSTVPEP